MKALLALIACLVSTVAAKVTEGTLGESKYMIAAPDEWQGKLLLLAHGFRPESYPLSADFNTADPFTTGLLAQGWCIASTSYRRNGWIVEDAILDLKELRDHVVKEHGEVKRCIVTGNSMGGLIGALIAEGALQGVHGVMVVGAYLGNAGRDGPNESLVHRPKMPILFLTNETELDHPREYRKKAGDELTALWEVRRPGHCNASPVERLNAVLAVDAWIDGKPPEKDRDGTVPPPERQSTAKAVDGGREEKITHVVGSWGNLSTGFVAADLEALGLKLGDTALFKRDDTTLEATVCRYRSDVPEGKTAAYITPDGWLAIVVNGGNAAQALGVKVGDVLTLSAKPGGTE